ncbi:MAG TPA: sensor histidine kinase, partial [Bacteroidia bacterium]|nr:sensor histidine kinase [Bacteroidia bacterium]
MVRPSTIGTFVVLALLLGPGLGRAQLRTVLEVRSLSAAEADANLPVDVRGTVVFVDGPATVFFQDDTAGTFFRIGGREAPRPGDEIRVTGMTTPGLYVPGIDKSEFEILGHPGLPEAPRIGFDDLRSGRFHYQRVTVEGIVRTVAADGEKVGVARVAVGSRVVEVRVEAPKPEGDALVDSRVRVTGLVAGELNPRRQLVEPYLRCQDWEEVEVLEPGRERGTIPSVTPDQLLNFAVG